MTDLFLQPAPAGKRLGGGRRGQCPRPAHGFWPDRGRTRLSYLSVARMSLGGDMLRGGTLALE
jgi:hypothetical protein